MLFAPSGALLEACVLALLNREDLYGYMLTQSMQSVANLSESTLYPVLRRLEKQGLLRVYDQHFQGRNRRYYAITAAGRAQLQAYRAEWNEYQKRLSHLILQEEEKTK